MSIELVMPSNHLILCHPFLLLPSVFSSIRRSDYSSFSFSISLSNGYSGLISFRTDWLDSPYCPRDSQESPPASQFESINFSVLSLPYGPTLTSVHDYWKNHSFDYMNLCWQSDLFFNMLSRFVITFLPRCKHLLILWLQSLSAVILEPKKIKSVTVSTFSPSSFH